VGGSGGTAGAGGCEGPLTTLDDCGACNTKCEPANATGATCETGTCAFADCEAGYQNCDSDAGNGCESEAASDVAHCGGCDMPCDMGQFENVENVTCEMSTCGFDACLPLFDDCDLDPNNGCEKPINTLTDCGGCGTACTPQNAINHDCSTGSCLHGGCEMGFLDCDNDPANGCESSSNDVSTCGACNVQCMANETCKDGMCTNAYLPLGPQTNVSFKTVNQGGWTQCYMDTYNQTSPPILSSILGQNCTKKKLMLACGMTNSSTLTLLAWAPRADVTTDTMKTNNPHNANGVGWYFNTDHSWGFAGMGDPLSLGSCDTNDVNSQFRLCWHTANDVMFGGYRCGSTTGLNNDSGWQRIIYHMD
jgi:hypothetical protein